MEKALYIEGKCGAGLCFVCVFNSRTKWSDPGDRFVLSRHHDALHADCRFKLKKKTIKPDIEQHFKC